jgi:APA family basic amino acid/polyamine antiporter
MGPAIRVDKRTPQAPEGTFGMPSEEQVQLIRGLGPYSATSVVAGSMIGTAVFLVSSDMLRSVGTPWRVIAVWVLAGVLSLFGALGYAELGAAIPAAGGEYIYLRRACGPALGFMYGWTQFIVAKTASIAAIGTGFLLYLAYFFPGLAAVLWQRQASLAGHSFTLKLTGIQAGATLLIGFISALNILGVRRSGALQTLFTAAKLAVLAILIVGGFAFGHGSFEHLHAAAPAPGLHGGVAVATVSALWAYDGWNNVNMVAGEVKCPERNMPLALIGGSMLVLLVYVLVNLAYFYVLTPQQVADTPRVAAEAARSFLGGQGGAFVAVGVLISTFATLNGSILSGSRIPYAQACDRLFPSALGHLHPRFRTPSVSLGAQALVAGLFALSGSYQALYTKAIYSEWIFYALVTLSLIILRRREPNLPRPYRAWGYPWVSAIFILVAVLLLAETFAARTSDAAWCLGLVASGIPAYWLWTQSRLWRGGPSHESQRSSWPRRP